MTFVINILLCKNKSLFIYWEFTCVFKCCHKNTPNKNTAFFLYCQEPSQAAVLFLVLNTDFHPGKDFVKENKFGVNALKKLA